LAAGLGVYGGEARDVAAGPCQAVDEAGGDHITAGEADNRDRSARDAGGLCRLNAMGEDDPDLEFDQVGRQAGEAIIPALAPPIFNREILASSISELRQSLSECVEARRQ